jgi:hypothetical protein
MGRAGKAVAWICIFSILFAGCYIPSLIDPAGDERDKIYSEEIKYIIMKDSTTYEFIQPPTVLNDTVFGQVAPKENGWAEVSISESDVAQVGQTQLGDIEYLVTKTGAKYSFKKPPTVVGRTIVGEAKLMMPTKSNQTDVTIPFSHVAQIGSSLSGDIEYLVTITGVKYAFDKPPAVVNKAFVGQATRMVSGQLEVTIPLSDVRGVCVSEFQQGGTGVLIVIGGTIVVAAVGFILILEALGKALHK